MTKSWIITGLTAGLLTSLFYPLLIFVRMPLWITVSIAAFIGPLLGIASYGLFLFGKLYKNSIPLQIGFISNIVAGVFFTTMLITQMAIKLVAKDQDSDIIVIHSIHYGLDVVWDIFIFLGTLNFSVGLYNHPRIHKIIPSLGLLLSMILMITNIATFPYPPASQYFDIGPFVGLWYFILILVIIRSMKWVNQKVLIQDAKTLS